MNVQQLVRVLVDNRDKLNPRLVWTTARQAPAGWVQHYSYWVGDTVEVDAYVWGIEIPEFPLEDLINGNIIFRRGQYEKQD
jgi:hypothetical protein